MEDALGFEIPGGGHEMDRLVVGVQYSDLEERGQSQSRVNSSTRYLAGQGTCLLTYRPGKARY